MAFYGNCVKFSCGPVINFADGRVSSTRFMLKGDKKSPYKARSVKGTSFSVTERHNYQNTLLGKPLKVFP